MDKKKINDKIEGYKQRTDIIIYGDSEKGYWELIGGTTDDRGNRNSFGIFYGRFIDALAYLVQQSGYGGWWCTNPVSDGHGKVQKYEIKILERYKG